VLAARPEPYIRLGNQTRNRKQVLAKSETEQLVSLAALIKFSK
jgi:hypothetical protein